MKMHNLGKRYQKEPEPTAVHADPARTGVQHPSFCLDNEQVPAFLESLPVEVSENKPGRMVRCEVLLYKCGHSQYGQDFKIVKIGKIAMAGKLTREEYLKLPKDKRTVYDQKEIGADDLATANEGDEQDG